MEVVRLNQNLFNKLRGNEISSNKNGSRPYYYSFKRNNNRVCISFRTNAQKVPNKYKIAPMMSSNITISITSR
ncbi:hypothetical protein ACGCJ4_06315, partial [Staphylococcus aureus]